MNNFQTFTHSFLVQTGISKYLRTKMHAEILHQNELYFSKLPTIKFNFSLSSCQDKGDELENHDMKNNVTQFPYPKRGLP